MEKTLDTPLMVGDEVVAVALEFPGEMVPLIRCGHGAVNAGVNPVAIGITPDVPLAGGDVALRAEDPAPAAIGLVAVEFQRLGVLRRGQVEGDIVLEVVSAIGCAKLLPPQGIGVGIAAGDGEDSGHTAHGGR